MHPARIAADLRAAFALLTRIPAGTSALPAAGSAWAWPLPGLAVGALAGLGGVGALALGLPAGFAAALALALAAVLTGALHEDGLADCADGFWGGNDRPRRLAIMKDSRIGTFGALALGLALLARWSLVAVLAGPALVPVLAVAGAVSRAPLPGLMALLPFARPGGLAAATGRPGVLSAGGALVLAAAAAVALLGPAGLAMLAAGVVAAVLTGFVARAKIGGQTGDVLGAAQVLGEIAALAVAVVVPK